MNRAVCAGMLVAFVLTPALGNAATPLAPGEHWLAAALDHRDTGLTVLIYQLPESSPLVRVLDLAELGIAFDAAQPVRHAAEDYVSADALPDHELHVDPAGDRVHFVRRVRPHVPEDAPEQLLLDVRINGVLFDQPLYLLNTGSDLVLPEKTLEALRISVPDAYGPFVSGGLPVHALAGEAFHFDSARLYLEMTVSADRFVTTHVAHAVAEPPRVTDRWPSAVLGYNVSGGRTVESEPWHAALVDLNVSAGTVTCSSRHLSRSSDDDVARLESNCIADWPAYPLSAGVGDNFTRPGALQQTVAYGGVWIGTDYALQPYRNLQPSLLVTGDARLPSTLEIWMDQQLGLRREIPPGPFVVDNLPPLSGTGNLQAVLVDATGRQVIVSAPVYSDPRLLEPGIADWRLDAGRLRPDGTADVYGERFGGFSGRIGLNRWLTGAVHAERAAAVRTWGGSVALKAWRFGLVELGYSDGRGAGSQAGGAARLVGYSWRGQRLHVAYREVRRERGYVALGYPNVGDAPTLERLANLGIALGAARLSLTGVERTLDDDTGPQRQRLATASLALRIGRVGQLLFTATRNFADAGAESVYGAQWSMPLGQRAHAYHSVTDDQTSTGAALSPPAGTGFGARLSRDSLPGSERYFVEGTARGNRAVGSASVQRDADSGADSWGGRVHGALIASRAGAGFSRDDGGSFAVVRTARGARGITVTRENQAAATTGRGGAAIVSGLRPYQINRLGLGVEGLPLSAQVSQDRLVVVPGRRSVVVADFGYEERRYLAARLVLNDGSDVPVGSALTLDGVEAGLVGYDGLVYAAWPDGGRTAVLAATWPQGRCETVVNPESVPEVLTCSR